MDTKQLKDFCFVTSSRSKVKDARETGKYRLYTSNDRQKYYTDDFEFNTRGIIVSTKGKPKIYLAVGQFSFSSDCIMLQSQNQLIDIEYVYYYLCAHKEKLEELVKASKGNHINRNSILSIVIEVPVLEVQRKITDLFSYLYKVIEDRRNIVARFPYVIYNYYLTMTNSIESKFWKEYSVDELANEIKAGASNLGISKRELSNVGGVYVVGIENIKHDIFEKSPSRYFQCHEYKSLYKYKVEANDVILSTRGTVGLSAVIPQNLENAIAGPNIVFIRLNEKVNPYFFSYTLIHNPKVQTWIKNTGQRTIINMLRISDIRRLKIRLPELKVQNYLEKVFNSYASAISKMKRIEVLLKELQSALLYDVFISPNGMLRQGNTDNDIDKLLRIVNGKQFQDLSNYDEIIETLYGMLERGEVKQQYNPQTRSTYLVEA